MKLRVLFIFIMNCYTVKALVLNLPQIQTDNVQLNTDANGYTLSLFLPPNSQRSESVNLDPTDGQLIVKGSMSTYYTDAKAELIVYYEADRNGYRASYKFLPRVPLNSAAFSIPLSASSLKGLAG